MAEPLTSSDIIMERMGFGVSPLASAETRRAYAAAGLSPLGTQERERFERGGALSPMASTAEKEAWKMAEFQAGRREQAPIEYGGLGDRPVGSSRRAIRMQDEWDKKQTELLNQQRLMQQMENEAKQMEAFDLDVRLKERQLSVAREEDIFNKAQQERTLAEQEQAFKFINSVRGQPDAYEAASEAIAGLPFAAASEPVQKALWALGQSRQVEKEAKAKELTGKEREDVAMVSEQTGLPISKFITTDPQTGLDVVDYEALGRAKGTLRAREEEEPTYGGKTERSIESIVTAISADIVEAQAAGDLVKVESLEAKKAYYENLVPKDNVENAAKPSNIPAPDKRKKGEVYDTPRGKLKWTGTGWVTP